MKPFIRNSSLVFVLLFLAFTCSHAQLPKDTTSYDYYAGASVDTFNILRTGQSTPYAIRFVTIKNDGINATDTLWVWFNNDSLTLKFYLLPHEPWNKNMLLKSVNTRSGASNVIRRRIIVKGQ